MPLPLEMVSEMLRKFVEAYMEENTNGVPSTNGVVIFQQVLFECIRISCFYYIHAHPVQGLNGFVYGPMFLVVVHVIEPDTE